MEKAGNKEATSLFALLIISHLCLDSLGGFAKNSGTAAFINAAITMSLALSVIVMADRFAFSVEFPEKPGVVGTCFSFSIFVLTLLNASSVLNIHAGVISSYMLPHTPELVIVLLLLICGFFGAYFGFEAITRYGFATLVVFAAVFVIILGFSASQIQPLNMFPVLGKGDFSNVLSMMYIFSDVLYYYIMRPRINHGKSPRMAIIVGGCAAIVLCIFYTLCVPYPVSSEFDFPVYALAALANSSLVFQRLDGMVFVLWMFSGFVSLGAMCLFATELLKVTSRLNDRKALCPVVCMWVLVLALWRPVSDDVIRSAMSITTFVVLPAWILGRRFLDRKLHGREKNA